MSSLTQLSRLRRFKSGMDVDKYLSTEFRQNLKAIEDALDKVTKTYSLYVKKSSQLPTVDTTESTITLWDNPDQNIGNEGSFDIKTGLWTCNIEASYLFIGRASVASNGTNDVTLRFYVNDEVISAANGLTGERKGPTVTFSKRLSIGDVVKMTIVGSGSQAMSQDDSNPIFFSAVKIGII